jgi:hypothetical protein
MRNGDPLRDAKTWTSRRRPEILSLYETEVFGRSPSAPAKLNYEVLSTDAHALGGKAVRKIVAIYFGGKSGDPKINLLVYLPANAKKPSPVFLGLSFSGIWTVADDPGAPLGGPMGAQSANARVRKANRAGEIPRCRRSAIAG